MGYRLKIGDRVKLSKEGIAADLHRNTVTRLGTVTSIKGGITDGRPYCGVLRDGSKSPVRYSMIFWELADQPDAMLKSKINN